MTPDKFVPEILTYRKDLASHFYLPYQMELEIKGAPNKMPFWWELYNGTIGPQQTDFGNVSTPPGCWILGLLASNTGVGAPGSCTVEMWDAQREELLQSQPIVSTVAFGTANYPFWLKKLYKMPDNGQVQTRVINLATVQNAIQIVAFGLRD